MKACSLSSISVAITFIILLGNSHARNARSLSPKFYHKTCPKALETIKKAVKTAVSRERRMAASLVRLHFHDCFVQGCDASVLITAGGERSALQNAGSIRGFEVVDDIKSRLESLCPGVVSCADILAVAARDASLAVRGPSWKVKLGRRDSTTAGSQTLAESDLPRGGDDLATLQSLFSRKGFSSRELVALSGSHTIGLARCVTFRNRIYSNDSASLDQKFARRRQEDCPQSGGDSNLAPLDRKTPNSFDNKYFKNLLKQKGLLTSDQVLFNGGSTDSIVTEYSRYGNIFDSDFGAAMLKMGDIDPLVGSRGEIRVDCKVFN